MLYSCSTHMATVGVKGLKCRKTLTIHPDSGRTVLRALPLARASVSKARDTITLSMSTVTRVFRLQGKHQPQVFQDFPVDQSTRCC